MQGTSSKKDIVIVTGSSGNIGESISKRLSMNYTVVGFDRHGKNCDIEIDITSEDSVELAFSKFRQEYGGHIAAVVHLAAYFDFTGNDSPLYNRINEEGTRRLLDRLQKFSVDRFIYASTMLVHKPGKPGELIDENTPIEPRWAYPQSKAATEEIIKQHHQSIPFAILRLAGLYDDEMAVPTLAHQIANIYERDMKSMLYAGDIQAGQSFIHREDLMELFCRVIDRRNHLDKELYLLAGEPEVLSYAELQHVIGQLVHGVENWKTLSVPKPLAKAGAWVEENIEPIIPDDFDRGQKPFIKPFMIELTSDNYDINISKAQNLLDWYPRHSIQADLPKLIDNLHKDPAAWYQRNKVVMPTWMENAEDVHENAEVLRKNYEASYRQQHYQHLWAPLLNMGFGCWLISAPFTMGYVSTELIISDMVCGVLIVLLAIRTLSPHPRRRRARWGLGVIGLWLMTAPLVFWAPTPVAYLNDTLVGALVVAFALLTRPTPGVSPTADQSGPNIPPGWAFSPSDWFQRLPIIALAFVGFFISRYLTAYQLGHIDSVWEPFFEGTDLNPRKNGTEEIITSSVSKAWPVPDAGLGALTYLLEILTGIMGSRARWRTMPWLVLIFGFMIIPLGAISITFIIIQPIVLDTWCTLCLIAAAAMLLQIPYSFDEIVATLQFLKRRAKAGKPWLRILFTGDTETEAGGKSQPDADDFSQSARKIIRNMLGGGVSTPWTLCVCCLIGVWLMTTRLTLGTDGNMANADHLIGALVLTVSITAFAEVMRALRFLNIFFGISLLITPFVLAENVGAIISSVVIGLALILLSIPKGTVRNPYGSWDRAIV